MNVRADDIEVTPQLATGWDLWLIGASLVLAGFGVTMILSASGPFAEATFHSAWHFGVRQVVGLTLGLFGGFLVLVVPWSWLRKGAPAVWAITLASLFLVHTPLGHTAKGARRWVDLGPLNLQPSEFAKIGLALVLADYLSRNEGHLKDVMGVVVTPVLLFLLPMLFGVYLQSDLGTIALMVGVSGVAFFVAGLDWKWVGIALGLTLVGVALLILYEPYRLQRVMTFADPLADPQGDGYQIAQGWVALAVGGLVGEGVGQGAAQQGFLPEAHTDMISAVIAEELGVMGWLGIFVLHGIVVWRGLHIASHAKTLFAMILATCLTSLLAAQVIVNTGVVGGLLPPKGLVLPFLSYGASAAIGHTLLVALLVRVGLETQRSTPVEV